MSDEKNTQPLHVTDDTQVLPGPGQTERLSEPSRPEDSTPEAPATDPLAVFDETRRDEPSPYEPSPYEPSPYAPSPPAPRQSAPERPLVRTGPRTGTIVWGFLVVAVGVGLLAEAAGARVDVELGAILLLGAAGALLVLGSLVSAARRRRDETRA
jgi:hypothetical protein